MRLAFKLMLMVVALVTLILLGESFLHLRHEAELHTADIEHEQHSEALIIEAALSLLGPLDSPEAGRLIEEAQRLRADHLVWLLDRGQLALSPVPGTQGQIPAPVQAAALKALKGQTVQHLPHRAQGRRWLYTLAPIHRAGDQASHILVLRAPLQAREAYIAEGLSRTIVQAALMVLLAALAAIWAGRRLVSRPIEILTEHAREVSKGYFDHPTTLEGEGEFQTLERELVQMASKLKSMQATLQEESRKHIAALEQLRHTDRLRTVGTLAAGVAHDLGTPLQIVLGRAERIARKSDNERVRQGAEIIVEQVARMEQIVRQLMHFAHPRGAEDGAQAQDLRALVSRACELVAPLDRKVRLSVTLGEQAVRVAVSPDHIEQVVVNLVANAIDASQEGDTVAVSVGQAEESGRVYAALHVSDEGTGMSPEIIEQVFDPFFTTKPVGSGTGLGLAIVYGIVQQYGGEIRAQSPASGGARFEVLFPLDHEAPTPAGAHSV